MTDFIWNIGDLIVDYDGDIGIVLGLELHEHPPEIRGHDGKPIPASKFVLVQWLDDGDWEPPYLESYRILLNDCKLLEIE
jgi:hypothetical protein